MDTKILDLVTSTLKFDLILNNFNLGHNFLTRRGRAFILHMYIPCDKPLISTLYPLTAAADPLLLLLLSFL